MDQTHRLGIMFLPRHYSYELSKYSLRSAITYCLDRQMSTMSSVSEEDAIRNDWDENILTWFHQCLSQNNNNKSQKTK